MPEDTPVSPEFCPHHRDRDKDKDKDSTPDDDGAAGDRAGTAGETGAERVRRCLLAPLQGLAPARRVPRNGGPAELTQAEMATALDGLARDLSHLDEVQLRGLMLAVVASAGHVGLSETRRWPGPGQVLAWGLALAPSPRLWRDHVYSIMSSACGAEALRRKAEVALFRRHRARAQPPPVGEFEWSRLKFAQENHTRQRARIAEKERDWGWDGLSVEDRAFAAAWDADAHEAARMVADGVAKRAGVAA